MIWRFLRFTMTTGIGILAIVWAIGFASYVGTVTAYVQPEIDINLMGTQAVVVLTGGTERLKAGTDLLEAGKGEKLLITGVNPAVKEAATIVDATVPKDLRECCIVLGHAANNTVGNAKETRQFMEDNGYRSLMLVTAHYHMPRSLMVFQKEMPQVKIIPYPVSPDIVSLKEWWTHTGTTSLLVVEYCKYALAWIANKLGP